MTQSCHKQDKKNFKRKYSKLYALQSGNLTLLYTYNIASPANR